MKNQFHTAFVFILIAIFTTSALSAAGTDTRNEETFLLWPEAAPGALGDADQDKPSITVFLAPEDKAVGTCVIVCPGGGYHSLMTGYEGEEMARWLNSIGVTGIVLKYRLARHGYHHPAWLQDAQRAISFVRAKAKQWNIDPGKIGIAGFSAGGHLSSTTAVHYKNRSYKPKDDIDKLSCRPDFVILVYPGITVAKWSEKLKDNLVGPDGDASLLEYLSTDRHVTAETAPTFLVHGSNDAMVGPEHSIAFYLACLKAGVPAELHIYQDGPHGFGMGQTQNTGAVKEHGQAIASWPKRCEDWMKELGLLDKKAL